MCCRLLSILLASLALGIAAGGDSVPSAEAKARISHAIAELGSDEFEARELAERVLRRIGPSALSALREAAVASDDAEVRDRAGRLARSLEQEGIAGILRSPLKLRLAVKDLPATEGVARLAELSKYTIKFRGDLPAKRVTLDTGEVTFWEALDALGRAAGLREVPVREEIPAKPGREPARDGPILLEAGDGPPTTYSGSVRIRALAGAANPDVGPGLTLNVQGEPRLRDFRVVPGSLRVTRAIDDVGQVRDVVAAREEPTKPARAAGIIINGRPLELPLAAVAQRTATLHLRPGKKASRVLRELSGTLTVTAEIEKGPVAVVLNPLAARDRAVTGRDGWSLVLHSMKKRADGVVEAKATVTRPAGNPLNAMGGGIRFGGRIVINGIAFGGDDALTPVYPKVVDEKGRPYLLDKVSDVKSSSDGNKAERTYSLLYKPAEASASPARMTLWTIEPAPLVVPFTLVGVPLP